MTEKEKELTIQQAAELTGLSVHTLRTSGSVSWTRYRGP
ncbi:hypothetical protein DJ90_5141 [Paenibacillus macerans]|uniref:DNA-binding protein n=1 Tax=Paenibacillus macerans TaxID=44252 RepID=A0A090ZEK1_PAEMA|nr:hypothetical protein DJ90_5141 [Paenibacillus macerans]